MYNSWFRVSHERPIKIGRFSPLHFHIRLDLKTHMTYVGQQATKRAYSTIRMAIEVLATNQTPLNYAKALSTCPIYPREVHGTTLKVHIMEAYQVPSAVQICTFDARTSCLPEDDATFVAVHELTERESLHHPIREVVRPALVSMLPSTLYPNIEL